MKRTVLALLAVFMMGSMASIAYGETAPASGRLMPGGWASASTDDEQVTAAAQYAVSTHAAATGEELKLSTIHEARLQVVAGLNYKFILIVVRNREAGNCYGNSMGETGWDI